MIKIIRHQKMITLFQNKTKIDVKNILGYSKYHSEYDIW